MPPKQKLPVASGTNKGSKTKINTNAKPKVAAPLKSQSALPKTPSAPPPKTTSAPPKTPSASVPVAVSVQNESSPIPGAVAISKDNANPVRNELAISNVETKSNTTPEDVRPKTKEDIAACKIQTCFRKMLSRKQLLKLKKEKENYEATMEKLEREAYAKMVKIYQEQAQKERDKEEEERKKRMEFEKRKKRMLEAAFEGNIDELETVLREVKNADDKSGVGTSDIIGRTIRSKNQMAMIECEDANNNTPLSEAAGGGHVPTISFLLEKGADPNSRGRFQRTPLYRAAFAGHVQAGSHLTFHIETVVDPFSLDFLLLVQVLLQNGADPRLYADDGMTPEQSTVFEPIQTLLKNWDINRTEALLLRIEEEKSRRRNEDRQRNEAETGKIENQIADAEKAYKSLQQKMCKAHCELDKRIKEHDKAVVSGFDRTDITMQTIHDAETDYEVVQIELERARDKVSKLKLELRDKQQEGRGGKSANEDLVGLKVTVRELDDVLIRDVGNRVKDSGKWPLIIDTYGQASTFLKYRDTNYIIALDQSQMEKEKIRIALLGSLRFGKALVLDMMEVDMFDSCRARFDEVRPGLMKAIMDKSVIKEEYYTKLLRPSDDKVYGRNEFNDLRLQNFKFFIITRNPFPPLELLSSMYPIRIHIPA